MKKWIILLAFGASICFAESRPNIIWIEADDLMPRFMNKAGDGFGLTPNLDRLAEQGVHFPNAVCQASMCGPSRNGLLTNLYPHNLGFYRNGNMRYLPEGIWTFPPVLQQAGYQTAYIGKSHIRPRAEDPKASKNDGLKALGFDHVNCTGERYALWSALKKGKEINSSPFIQHLKRRGKFEQWVEDNTGYENMSTMEEDIDYLDGFTTQVGVDWLTEGRDENKPFFLWFNFCLPHGPYDVAQRWYDKVADLDIPPPKTDSFGHELTESILKEFHHAKGPEKVKKGRRGEAANVAFMDAMIGRLLDALEASGELENTVVIFFSDHSIFLGNHGGIHKGTLFEENLNASMIVSWPKEFPQDQVNPHPMELLDLVPTTFELAGVTNPNDVAKNGLSILPMLGTKTGVQTQPGCRFAAVASRQPHFVSNGRKFAFSEMVGAQAATDDRYRYITSDGVEFLYDHQTDPYEMKNVAAELPEVAERMRKAVKNWMETTGPVYPPTTRR